MNHKRIFIFLLSAMMATMLLAACSSGAAKNKFPTGNFVSSSNQDLAYEFNDDNTWAYYTGGLMAAKGNYRIEGNLWIEEGTSECPFEGSYQWTFDGKSLSFKLNGEDNCAPRKAATDGQTFVLSK